MSCLGCCYVRSCGESATRVYHMAVPVAEGQHGRISACLQHIKAFEASSYRGRVTCLEWLAHSYGACRCYVNSSVIAPHVRSGTLP